MPLVRYAQEVVISVTEERSLASDRNESLTRKLEFLEQEEELIEEENADQQLEENQVRENEELQKAAKAEAEAEAAAEGGAAPADNEIRGAKDAAAAETSFDVQNGAAAAGVAAGEGGTRSEPGTEGEDAAAESGAAAAKTKTSKKHAVTIDSVSLDEVESVVAGRRARRAAKLSRILIALARCSSLSVERQELLILVRKGQELFGHTLLKVEKQTKTMGRKAVAVALAAEGDVQAAIEMLPSDGGSVLVDDKTATKKEEVLKKSKEDEQEERMPNPDELTPDESGDELVAGARAGAVARGRGDDDERMSDPWEVVEDGEGEEKRGWFRADNDFALCDRVNTRVQRMLEGVKRDLAIADGAIGEKLHVLDTDNDGRISLSELTRVGGVLADQLNDEDLAELQEIIKGFEVDEEGRISVKNLSAFVDELVDREFKEWDGDEDGVAADVQSKANEKDSKNEA